jgi:hypothetical protein
MHLIYMLIRTLTLLVGLLLLYPLARMYNVFIQHPSAHASELHTPNTVWNILVYARVLNRTPCALAQGVYVIIGFPE